MLSKEVSSTIFKVFGMTRPGIEPRSPGALPSDYLVSYLEHSLGESYFSAEMQLVYSAAPANWDMLVLDSNA